MTPLVVIALLIGFAAAFVWQRTRVAGARLLAAIARAEARTYAAGLGRAWDYADALEDENVRLRKESADQWNDGYLYAANIDARGEVDR